VTFLAAVCASEGAPSWLPDATLLFIVAGLAGIAVSITGNETAQRWGRGRVVTVAMSTAAALSLLTGWSPGAPAVSAAMLVVLWNAAIYSRYRAAIIRRGFPGNCTEFPVERRTCRPGWLRQRD
jgi:predicted MFS family arabinose efflux permease